jgi:uncharacterized protein (DUF983 family)
VELPDGPPRATGWRRPKLSVALLRGFLRRCTRCGCGKLFRRWFTLTAACPRCGLLFEREEGAFLGSLVLNYGVSSVLGLAFGVTWFALTWPDTKVVPLTVATVAVIIVSIAFFYPFAKTTWSAIDLFLHTPDD